MAKIFSLQRYGAIDFRAAIKRSIELFRQNDPLRLAGATAFFANFAIPPILLILTRLFGFFVDKKLLTQQLFERISDILIPSSAYQIREVYRNIRDVNQTWWATALSFIFLLFVATTLFGVIKNSVEQIWNIGQNSKRNMLVTLKSRGRSIFIILLAGILFFFGLFTDSLRAGLNDYFMSSQYLGKGLLWLLNQIMFTTIVSFWFAVLFRFLTNARPSWSMALLGGLLTGVLFNLGKHILRIMLPMSRIEDIYGAAGSLILVMLFVFYSSLIFYFGACFIRSMSEQRNKDIRTIKGAFRYEIVEVDR